MIDTQVAYIRYSNCTLQMAVRQQKTRKSYTEQVTVFLFSCPLYPLNSYLVNPVISSKKSRTLSPPRLVEALGKDGNRRQTRIADSAFKVGSSLFYLLNSVFTFADIFSLPYQNRRYNFYLFLFCIFQIPAGLLMRPVRRLPYRHF